MNYLRRRCTWNIHISPLTRLKITKLMIASYLFFHLSRHAENETKSSKRWFWLACEHRRSLVGYLKYNYSGLWALRWCKQHANWTTLSYSSNCSIFSAKKLETTSTTTKQQNLKNGKVRFRLNIEVRKEMEDSRLNAIDCLKTDYVRKRSTEF